MKSILIGLLFTSWILSFPAYTQSEHPSTSDKPIHDPLYCLPIEKARLLVADAVRLRLTDSLLNLQSGRIVLLESQQLSSVLSYTKLLKISEQKYLTQKENTGHMESLAMSYKSERDYYIKRERKQRRKKNILSYGLLALLGIIIVK